MATILEFRQPSQDDGKARVLVPGHTAEIVIFPGVRIERYGQRDHAPKPRTMAQAYSPADPGQV